MMTPWIDPTRTLPAYHEGMLLVKTRPAAGALAAAAAGGDLAEGLIGAPGLSALAVLDRAGLVRRVTPLTRRADEERAILGAGGVVAALAEAAPSAVTSDPNAGVSLVEVERDSDLPNLQLT